MINLKSFTFLFWFKSLINGVHSFSQSTWTRSPSYCRFFVWTIKTRLVKFFKFFKSDGNDCNPALIVSDRSVSDSSLSIHDMFVVKFRVSGKSSSKWVNSWHWAIDQKRHHSPLPLSFKAVLTFKWVRRLDHRVLNKIFLCVGNLNDIRCNNLGCDELVPVIRPAWRSSSSNDFTLILHNMNFTNDETKNEKNNDT